MIPTELVLDIAEMLAPEDLVRLTNTCRTNYHAILPKFDDFVARFFMRFLDENEFYEMTTSSYRNILEHHFDKYHSLVVDSMQGNCSCPIILYLRYKSPQFANLAYIKNHDGFAVGRFNNYQLPHRRSCILELIHGGFGSKPVATPFYKYQIRVYGIVLTLLWHAFQKEPWHLRSPFNPDTKLLTFQYDFDGYKLSNFVVNNQISRRPEYRQEL